MVGADKGKRTLDKEDRRITIGIQSQDGVKVLFRVKRDLPLQKVLMKYCEKKKLEYRAMRFVYEGRKVLVRKTPDELHMEEETHIDAIVDANAG